MVNSSAFPRISLVRRKGGIKLHAFRTGRRYAEILLRPNQDPKLPLVSPDITSVSVGPLCDPAWDDASIVANAHAN